MNCIRPFMQRLYRLSFCASLLILSSLSFNALLMADSHHHHRQTDDLELGIELETKFWTLVQNHEVEKFSKKLTPIFQGLNVSGAYTRDQQIEGLAAATLTNFAIYNPVATRFHDILVFSYDFVAIGNGLTSGPTITIWKKYSHSWKIISHSYVPFTD